MVDQYSFYNKLLPWVFRNNDPEGAMKAIVDGVQEQHNQLRDLALALPRLVDLDNVPAQYLAYLADHVGLDVEACDPPNLVREQIRSAVPIYRIKGTILSFESLLRTLGFKATVVPLFEDSPDATLSMKMMLSQDLILV